MLENLWQFHNRVNSFIWDSLPHQGSMMTNGNLGKKVDEQGRMRPFVGNTVVFLLPREAYEGLAVIQKRLYENCGDMLAEPLAADTFHITLHDLLNGEPTEELEERMRQIQERAGAEVRFLQEKQESIHLKSIALFNMVGTSMVLGFEPAGEEDCRRLMEYYELFQGVVFLGYPLTPHVTQAYFKPGLLQEEQLERLRRTIEEVKGMKPLEIELNTRMLAYQRFADMNHYWSC